jgi:hypothetical protein
MTITGEPMWTQTTHYDSPGLAALVGKRVRISWRGYELTEVATVRDVDRQAGFVLLDNGTARWCPLADVSGIEEATE